MGIVDRVAALERIEGARVGHGPRHPEAPDPLLEAPLAGFLAEHASLREDGGYVEFLEKYAGAAIENPARRQIVDILGFSAASTGLEDMDGPVVDEDGFLLFAQCVYHVYEDGRLVDTYEYDFAFDTTGARDAGVYRMVSCRNHFDETYRWHLGGFEEWLGELVDADGMYPRPVTG